MSRKKRKSAADGLAEEAALNRKLRDLVFLAAEITNATGESCPVLLPAGLIKRLLELDERRKKSIRDN